jgi:hypothetical protein
MALLPSPTVTASTQIRGRKDNTDPASRQSPIIGTPTDGASVGLTTRLEARTFSRYFGGKDGQESFTDYDRCLPGPATCGLVYSGKIISCPTPYSRASYGEIDGKSTVYCCFR